MLAYEHESAQQVLQNAPYLYLPLATLSSRQVEVLSSECCMGREGQGIAFRHFGV